MPAKFQVFISSSFEDLKEEREDVIRTVLKTGHIPIGMELFNAASEAQWKVIARRIDQADYYVVIVANRYGSVAADGTSYTEKEFSYAVSKGVPVLAFIIEEKAPWPSTSNENDPEKRARLDAFKQSLKDQYYVDFWTSRADLRLRVAYGLSETMQRVPRPGLIPPSECRDAISSTATTGAIWIDITNLALINSVLSNIGADTDLGAYTELKGGEIRSFQDQGIAAMLQKQEKMRSALRVYAFDITMDPQIWLNRRDEYIELNAEVVRAGGQVSRVFFVEIPKFLDDNYRDKLYQLFKICFESRMDVALCIMSGDGFYEDFVVFPGLGVLKEIRQPAMDDKNGAAVAFFDDESIRRFRRKFKRKCNDNAKARAAKFVTNVEEGLSGAQNLASLTSRSGCA